ncbi:MULTISPECIES: lytic transglycosylase domain-containing protein [unclassified Spirosoma]|uniref:lytic transglycosylase domain-containing protein n=1 Tax=unclassified Spirosoma TaxID=2621999 RepID=UPI00095D1707|nr:MULTISPECIES: lytic transglycosylase domain-containing protein [unclassified Spirosoma]MBN8823246.1 lytic transglycosylase domain-containing protein [Spirosoma sp.]OJW72605.1 MAG: lytic murein transglycosylase [Spirosoma sp. 48-14]
MAKLSLIVAAGLVGVTLMFSSAVAQTNSLLALNVAAPVKALATHLKGASNDESPVHFCGEIIPINQPAIVQRWIRTLNQQASYAEDLTILKRRAAVVFPLIEPILKQYRIPSDFKFLPLLESAVTNHAVSRKGAAGFWQLMPQTAQSLGLNVSRRRDERFNLVKATHAACRYINDLYDQLGSWMLVATAYNAGPNYIQQLTRQHPNVHPMALPYRAAETKAYLYQTVAIKELLTRPQNYRDRLSSRHLAALSNGLEAIASAERATILSSFDIDEKTFESLASNRLSTTGEEDGPVFVSDSTTNVVLLTDDEETEPERKSEVSVTTTEPAAPVEKAASPSSSVVRLVTRSLSEGPVTEGQLCMFQVVQPVTLNGRTFAVGDLIQAHVEIIDPGSGRVFLRTDRLTSAQTQQVSPLKLVATEQPKQPGVSRPSRLDGWQLTWEEL